MERVAKVMVESDMCKKRGFSGFPYSLSYLLFSLGVLSCFAGCSGVRARPCAEGGQAPRDGTAPFEGIKRCYQIKDPQGRMRNHGKYLEWHPNDKLALTGEYKLGKKVGRWVEYDPQGKKISDRIYEDGKLISENEI